MPMNLTLRPRHALSIGGTALAALVCTVLAGCTTVSDSMPSLAGAARFDPDDFESINDHTRHINAPKAQACEAARRALLSQGYLVNTATDDMVAGRKYFQPSTDIHYEVEMRVVCAPEGADGKHTAAFASALQDRYVIKKINNSASLGVGALGSLSLPVSASDDTLVKVGSETVTDKRFYERFFELFGRFVLPPAAPAPESATPMLVKPQPQIEERTLPAAPPAQPAVQPEVQPAVQPGAPAGPTGAAEPAAAPAAAASAAAAVPVAQGAAGVIASASASDSATSATSAASTADLPLPALADPTLQSDASAPGSSATAVPASGTARP